ncbi:YebC/PmpR family DNA-binding transcriptional regulator [Blattabacterium cuenoti]|uniref:YebC/PmpR family DNA-binding transcriptional regulator n=1 Tax=Blattabacterium cuenoti TaxID=1653831 RepID=UPI00163BA863|nr:YebC/PmpR family DNA-binding transcriptional regulator [Blattabacterium cuenoti]
MSGHSKWSNIQHRKNNQDLKKSKKFSKIIQEIISIVKKSGRNSFRFKNIISNAKSLNIPKSTIEKAIKKSLQKRKNDYKNLNLEGKIYGIGIIMECITDNNIRTTSSIRTFFNKNGGVLCNNGELIHFFKRIGNFFLDKENLSIPIEKLELMLIDFGAKDIIDNNKNIQIITDFEYFGIMKQNLEKLKIFHEYQLERIPIQKKLITKEKKNKVIDFIKKLEKHDDIENIYYNLYI